MNPFSMKDQLSALMISHDVPFHIEEDWIVPFGQLPAIRAIWYPREHSGVLEVEVLLAQNQVITECFAGFGTGNDAISDAIQNFCVNSLHVLLAAFWHQVDENQVLIENWVVNQQHFTAYIGNLGHRSNLPIEPNIPECLFPEVQKTIEADSLTKNTHWFRVFFANVSGEFTFEALHNNDVWEKGLKALRLIDFEKNDGYYSLRLFLILVPKRLD